VTLKEAVITVAIAVGCISVIVTLRPTIHGRGCERNASASLKTLATAEADFRANDRDGNGVNDYGTGDVYGLYGLIPVTAGSTTLPADATSTAVFIKLVETSAAGADGRSRTDEYGNVTVAFSIVIGSPKAGYIYRAFTSRVSNGRVVPLQNDTDPGLYGAVHDLQHFAFMACPESFSAGRQVP